MTQTKGSELIRNGSLALRARNADGATTTSFADPSGVLACYDKNLSVVVRQLFLG
jgi:hypothetical protein